MYCARPPTTGQPLSAAAELARRQRVRGDMCAWAQLCGFSPARHHKLLIDKLQRVARGDIKKLAFFLPPGSAKSTYSSVLFVPWYMASAQGRSVIAASHTTELSERFSRRVRALIQEHGPALGIALSEDSQAAGRWSLRSGGEYLAAGVGSAILGFRADLLLLDDPIRSREEAFSQTVRESVWDWFHASARTRLRPGGAQILIMTRFHEDDLAGRLLQREADWAVMNLPAEAEDGDPLGREPGEMLWGDDGYGYAASLREQKATQLPAIWSALYQGRPAPEEGDYFKAGWFKPYAKAPPIEMMHIYGACDWAVSEGRGDYTVHLVVGQDPRRELYLLDMWRKQADTATSVDAFLDLARRWRPIGWGCEKGQLANSIEPFLRERQRMRGVYVAMQMFPTRGDKSVRAQSIRGRMALSGLHVPAGAPWLPDLMHECLSFPAGKHDDQVVALGLIGQILDLMVPGRAPAPAKPPKVLSTVPSLCTVTMNDLWREADRGHQRNSRRIW